MLESPGQSYMKAHQLEIAFAADSKLNITNCGFFYLLNKNSRCRQPEEDLFSHSAMLPRTQILSVFLTLSCHLHSLCQPQYGFPGFKYHFDVLSKKKRGGYAMERLSSCNFGMKSFQQSFWTSHWSEWDHMDTPEQLIPKGNEISTTELNFIIHPLQKKESRIVEIGVEKEVWKNSFSLS